MITDIKKILTELSYRVKDGCPDFENEQHLIKLYDVLKEYQWPADARIELIKTLTERMVPNPNPSPNARKKMVTIDYARTFYKDRGVDSDDIKILWGPGGNGGAQNPRRRALEVQRGPIGARRIDMRVSSSIVLARAGTWKPRQKAGFDYGTCQTRLQSP